MKHALCSLNHSLLPPAPNPGEPRFDNDGDPGMFLVAYLVACVILVAIGAIVWRFW